MSEKKRILIAPLDWGLGHATRCIPIIRELIHHGDEVWIAAEGNSAHLLKKEFPELEVIPFRGYKIRYSSFLNMSFTMMFQLPKMLLGIFMEHQRLKKIIREFRIDAVISDNRYGLWNRKIHSVFLTHQVRIKCPPSLRFLEPVLQRITGFFIRRFNECWIPDDERNLSGELSGHEGLPSNAKRIGILSRWNETKTDRKEKKFDVLGIISGPEPHRSSFEKLLISQFIKSELRCRIILGKPGEKTDACISKHVQITSHLESTKLLEAIMESGIVICRSGYSGIMDLTTINRDAILIPTRGQTEQEYLADHMKKRTFFFSMDQSNFNLESAMEESKNYSVNRIGTEKNHLPGFIAGWRNTINAS